jgi:alpha-glucosidase
MVDGGYDVADYCDVDPLFGTLDEAEQLIAETHRLGLRVIVDIVPNHCSDRHEWFEAALCSPPGSTERARFWFRHGRGPGGELPPNDWRSSFGGSAWTRLADGDWYLHLFAPEQPDFNWTSPDVHAEFERVLHFWLDRGVDGFRIDVAHGLVKKEGLPDIGAEPDPLDLPNADRPEVHDIWREWRRVVDGYRGDRALLGEIWVAGPESLVRYLRPGELHSVFNFDFLLCDWDAGRMRRVIERTVDATTPLGAAVTWVLSSHDVVRHVTRYGTASPDSAAGRSGAVDLELGTRRARAAALLMMSLPGSVCVYQGEELGLWEVDEIPDDLRQDPIWRRSGFGEHGRDGCRVPIPWEGDEPPFGFDLRDSKSWLPQPREWRDYSVGAESADPGSMLMLYHSALQIRKAEPDLIDGEMSWIDAPAEVIAFRRGRGLACLVNFSATAVDLPAHWSVLLASAPLEEGRLPGNAAVWLRLDGSRRTIDER